MKNTNTKNTKGTETVAKTLAGFAKDVLSLIVYAYMLLMLAILPFYATRGYAQIGTDKYTFFKDWTLRIGKLFLPCLLIYLILRIVMWLQAPMRKNGFRVSDILSFCKHKLSVTDCFALVYAIGLLLSYACSAYRENALWGAPGWYMGLFTQLSLLAAYFAISRLWGQGTWMLYLLLAVSAIVFAWCIANRFGYYPDFMPVVSLMYVSSIGNINWFCGYLVCTLFVGLGLYWRGSYQKTWQQTLLLLYVGIGLLALVLQSSMSGYLALFAVAVVLFELSATDVAKMKRFWFSFALMGAELIVVAIMRKCGFELMNIADKMVRIMTGFTIPLLLLLIAGGMSVWMIFCERKNTYPEKLFVILRKVLLYALAAAFVIYLGLTCYKTAHPEALPFLPLDAFTFSPNWASRRGSTFALSFMSYKEQNLIHKLLGVGPDCMVMAIYQSKDPAILEYSQKYFGQAVLTNTHCEWFTIFLNTGIIGLIGFAGMMVSAICRYIKAGKSQMISAACGIALLAYTANNLFSFQQIMNIVTMFILLGIGEACLRKQ